MASSRSNISYHVRSASFPSTSHPSTLRVETQLNKIKISSSPSAEEICNNLSSLKDLYNSMDGLLNSQETQQALSHNQTEKLSVDELLDGSVQILDICGSIKDLASQIKENIQDLQSALRRRKGDSSIESNITKYISFHKKMMKEAKRLTSSLKQMEIKTALTEVDHQLSLVIKVVREVRAVDISIFRAILLFVSVPILKPKHSKWSLFSKAEVESQNQLKENTEALECSLERIENGLEEVFRGMVRTRASLLNTISSF